MSNSIKLDLDVFHLGKVTKRLMLSSNNAIEVGQEISEKTILLDSTPDPDPPLSTTLDLTDSKLIVILVDGVIDAQLDDGTGLTSFMINRIFIFTSSATSLTLTNNSTDSIVLNIIEA